MIPIALIVVLLICLLSPAAATAQDTTASTNVAKEDSQFRVFEWKGKPPGHSGHGDWLRGNQAVFDHADYCTLTVSAIDVGPHASGMGSGVSELFSFLVLRDVDESDFPGRTFHDADSGLDIDVSFEFSAAIPPGHGNGKGYPSGVLMSLSVHRGEDDRQGNIEQAEAQFFRDKTWWKHGLILKKVALVGDTTYTYGLACSDPRERLRFWEGSSRVRHKR